MYSASFPRRARFIFRFTTNIEKRCECECVCIEWIFGVQSSNVYYNAMEEQKNERIDIDVEKHAFLHFKPLQHTTRIQFSINSSPARRVRVCVYPCTVCVNQMSARIGTNKNLFQEYIQQNVYRRLASNTRITQCFTFPFEIRQLLLLLLFSRIHECMYYSQKLLGDHQCLCVCVFECVCCCYFSFFSDSALAHAVSMCIRFANDMRIFFRLYFDTDVLKIRIYYILTRFYVHAYRCVCTSPKLYNILWLLFDRIDLLLLLLIV